MNFKLPPAQIGLTVRLGFTEEETAYIEEWLGLIAPGEPESAVIKEFLLDRAFGHRQARLVQASDEILQQAQIDAETAIEQNRQEAASEFERFTGKRRGRGRGQGPERG